MKKIIIAAVPLLLMLCLAACGSADAQGEDAQTEAAQASETQAVSEDVELSDLPEIQPGETAQSLSLYTDSNGDTAVIPAQFMVSQKESEQTVNSGVVVIGPDESEYVWIPTTDTKLEARDFGTYFFGGDFSQYSDETELTEHQAMENSTERFGGFYMGRYEASEGEDGLPVSKRIADKDAGKILVQFSPQDATVVCQELYADNNTVQGFFPWGCNWDTTLQWLIDSGGKTEPEVASDSTSWGNYSDDSFSDGADGRCTGIWEEASANNIYDLAGNNWEWTQERCDTNYVMRGGGYSLMGGSCSGSSFPASLRDPLPGNDHHPNVTFRPALYVQ